MQEYNFTVETVDVRDTGATIVQSLRIVWQIDGSSVGYVEKRVITEEPAESQGQAIREAQLKGIIVADYVIKAATIVGLALKWLG